MNTPKSSASNIAHELSEWGEDPLSSEERRMIDASVTAPSPATEGLEGELASMAWLLELAEPLQVEALSELETQRAWRKIEGRVALAAPPRARSSARATALVALLGAAAALALLFSLAPDDQPLASRPQQGPTAAEVAEIGDQARASLRALDRLDQDKSEAERAAELVRRYEAELGGRPG